MLSCTVFRKYFTCGCCQRLQGGIELRRLNTAFANDEENLMRSCLPCYEEMYAYYEERWADYYAGRY
jgi:hypothetical protein